MYDLLLCALKRVLRRFCVLNICRGVDIKKYFKNCVHTTRQRQVGIFIHHTSKKKQKTRTRDKNKKTNRAMCSALHPLHAEKVTPLFCTANTNASRGRRRPFSHSYVASERNKCSQRCFNGNALGLKRKTVESSQNNFCHKNTLPYEKQFHKKINCSKFLAVTTPAKLISSIHNPKPNTKLLILAWYWKCKSALHSRKIDYLITIGQLFAYALATLWSDICPFNENGSQDILSCEQQQSEKICSCCKQMLNTLKW